MHCRSKRLVGLINLFVLYRYHVLRRVAKMHPVPQLSPKWSCLLMIAMRMNILLLFESRYTLYGKFKLYLYNSLNHRKFLVLRKKAVWYQIKLNKYKYRRWKCLVYIFTNIFLWINYILFFVMETFLIHRIISTKRVRFCWAFLWLLSVWSVWYRWNQPESDHNKYQLSANIMHEI